ncbi:hypothetical protein SEA_WATERT_20 [Microbacterium phage WaterT]|nr:hypothetical protein SEA_WATERT_20 [Microbacterium phage WaterT]QDK01418.1 hypothetical protein SEA_LEEROYJENKINS_21 [Microbacterium phage LeeroyJenkins]
MVDKHITYSDIERDSLASAFSFVMDYVDEFEAPTIAIVGYRRYSSEDDLADDTGGELMFSVSVSGDVN